MSRILGLTAACALTVGGLAAVPTTAHAAPATAPAAGLLDVIVTLAPGADARTTAEALVTRAGGTVTQVYSHALNGFAATLTDSLLAVLRADARVWVRIDRVVHAATAHVAEGAERAEVFTAAMRDLA